MKKVTVVVIFLSSFLAKAQLILPAIGDNEQHYNSQWMFNTTHIQQQNVKTITGKVSIKHDQRPIKRLGLKEFYRFDNKGRIGLYYETFYGFGYKLDTLPRFYSYNQSNLLVTIRTSDAYGFYSHQYEYDSQNLKTKEIYEREETKPTSKLSEATGKKYLVKTEKYEYQSSSAALKRVYLNDNGIPYQEEVFQNNEQGQIIEKNIRLKVAGGSRKIIYTYANELLTEKTITSTFGNSATKKEALIYDNQSRLTKIKFYKNDQLQKTLEFVYDQSDNGLLKAKLLRDEQLKAINIVEYSYTYW